MEELTQRCGTCGVPSAAGVRFCAACGARLVPACATCGAELPAGASFCPSCGAAAGPASGGGRVGASRVEGRKVVTALFADIVGSTVLGERFDPEDYRAIVGDAVTRMVAAVEHYGGSVRDLAGDGVLALYGVPAAHEDDAERALLAALRIIESIADYAAEVEQRWGLQGFSVRVGIETGLAVLGPVGGGAIELGAMGDVLNTAARLQASCQPGSVLVGPLTQRMVAPLFEWGPPSTLELKGKAEPVTAYPVAGRRASAVGRLARGGTESKLVGREEELALGATVLEELAAGRGGILLVSGEAGIGKTRLIDELHARFRRIGGTGATWLRGRCVSYGDAIPYLPFHEMLRGWLGVADSDDAPLRAALLERTEELLGAPAAELAPFLVPLVGLAPPGDPAPEPARRGSPRALQGRIHEAFRALLDSLAARGPVVICLDDLHWGDASTLGLLERLLATAEEARVLLVLAQRPEPAHGSWRVLEMARRELPDRIREIELEPLPPAANRGLLADLAGAGTLPEALERELLARADGNPFYLEELVGTLTDSGALVSDAAGGWRFRGEVELELPQTIERVILARVDRLSGSGQELIRAASVLGREFGIDLLVEVTAADGGVAEPLLELEQADLLRRGGEPTDATYGFRHQMIQEACYASLLKARRRHLHARAAEGLERLLGQRVEEQLGVVARHYTAADYPDRAFDYHRRAAEAASRIYAHEEAVEHYTGALEAALRMSDPPAQHVLAELRRARGITRLMSGDAEEGSNDFEVALAEARAAGDRRGEIAALLEAGAWRKGHDFERAIRELEQALAIAEELGDPAAQVRALNRLALCCANRLELDRGLELSRRALRLARELGDEELLTRALDGLKLNLLSIGDAGGLGRACAELEPILRDRGELWYLQWPLLEGAAAAIARGEWEAASSRLDEGTSINRRIRDLNTEPLFLEARCRLEQARGRSGVALAAGRQAVLLAEGRGVDYWQAWAAASLGCTLLDLFAAEEASDLLARGLEVADRAGLLDQRIRCTAELARARALEGRAAEAVELSARGEELLGSLSAPPGDTFLLATHAFLALGRVRLAAGHVGRALGLLEPLLGAARKRGWVEGVVGAALLVGRCHAARGNRERALPLLEEAVSVTNEDRFPLIAWQAQAALAELARSEGEPDAAARYEATARDVVGRIGAAIDESELRERFVERALAVVSGGEAPVGLSRAAG